MQRHLDRLTAIDASFLHQEGPSSHMHVGALVELEGPPPDFDGFLDSVRERLHLVPRYRQRLAFAPGGTGHPLWVDDTTFQLEYHVRRTALPKPGSEEQLLNLAARIFSQQLDRSRPLWEMWLVEGMDGGRCALISKTHHAVIDGIAGVDLGQVMFDLAPDPEPVTATEMVPWSPESQPPALNLLAAGLVGLTRAGVEIAGQAVAALRTPELALARAREALGGIGEIAWAGLNPAPATPLNTPIGPHRRVVGVPCELADFKTVKNVFGGTVNDVVLTVVAGALRHWLQARGVRTEGMELRALVPVSIRSQDDRGHLGNRIAAMRGPLPVYIEDPVQRLHAVSAAMENLKASKQAIGAEVLAGAQNFAPPTVLAQASRLNFSTRLFNLIVTNVPGPQIPLYVRGRRMERVFPVAFLPADHALAIAIMSYDGQMNFGLLGDYDALPDIDLIAESIEGALAELLGLAEREAAVQRQARAPSPVA